MGGCLTKENVSLQPESGHCCFEIISAKDAPRADFMDESDCYVVCWLSTIIQGGVKNNQELRITKKMSTPVRDDTKDPIWNSFKDFRVDAPAEAVLVVEVWDEDFSSSNDRMGSVRIPLSAFDGDKPLTVPISDYYIGTRQTNPDFQVTVRRVPLPKNLGKKTLFLVRHGQSKWNLGKKEGDLSRMMYVDHPLTRLGATQAMEANRRWQAVVAKHSPHSTTSAAGPIRVSTDKYGNRNSGVADTQMTVQGRTVSGRPAPFSADIVESRRNEYIHKFLSATGVLSSPLTRALQTCLLVMEGHEALRSAAEGGSGIQLYSHIREVKNVGGQDSVGQHKGAAIAPAARQELVEMLGEERVTTLMQDVQVHVGDTDQKWWKNANSYESKNDVKTRVAEFFNFVKYSEHDTIVCVGHSAFFKKLCSSSVGDELAQTRPVMHDNMRERKLNNGAVLAVTVDFGAGAVMSSTGQPLISDADLMFGSKFVSPSKRSSMAQLADKNLFNRGNKGNESDDDDGERSDGDDNDSMRGSAANGRQTDSDDESTVTNKMHVLSGEMNKSVEMSTTPPLSPQSSTIEASLPPFPPRK